QLTRDPVLRVALIAFVFISVIIVSFFSYYYVKYDRIIEKRFHGPVFASAAKIYANPRAVRVGEKLTAHEIVGWLQGAGYTDRDGQSPLGTYHVRGGAIEVKPGPESYHSPEAATIQLQGGKIDRISSRGGDLEAYELEPALITSL